MPPKPAPNAKAVDTDAVDHEKEFVEKELVISFLKTRLSRYSPGDSHLGLLVVATRRPSSSVCNTASANDATDTDTVAVVSFLSCIA